MPWYVLLGWTLVDQYLVRSPWCAYRWWNSSLPQRFVIYGNVGVMALVRLPGYRLLVLMLGLLPLATAVGAPPQPPATAAPAEDGNWPVPAKNYVNTRFSGLDEIN